MKTSKYIFVSAICLFSSSLAFSSSQSINSLNEQKVDTIKSMYMQHELENKVVDGGTTGLDLLYLYGGLELKDAIMGYKSRMQRLVNNNQDSFMDCSEVYFSIYSKEMRDDFRMLKLDDAHLTSNGKVRATIKGYTLNGDIISYDHDYTLMCHGDQCQITDLDVWDGHSLKESLDELCH